MTNDFIVILPELALSVAGLVMLLGAVYTSKDKTAPFLTWITAGLFVFLAFWIGMGGSETQTAFSGTFVSDAFSRFAKVVLLCAAAVVLLLAQDISSRRGDQQFEFPILVIFCVVGMMVMVSTSDLIVLYLGLELQSLSIYVLVTAKRDSLKSTEAGLKYFVLGALSSGLLLYGASLVYGFSGTTQFAGISASIAEEFSLGLLFGLVFVIAGLAFKLSLVPFHMWTPDVYEGAPTPVTAFLATAPKMAAVGLMTRVLYEGFGNVAFDWQQILAMLSALSIFIGAVGAIGQRNIKRMLAYSSISHMGFVMMGLVAADQAGVAAALVYMVIYVVMSLGTFAFVMAMQRDGQPITDINSLKQYSKTDPLGAICMALLMFSLMGLPPLAGFWGKLFVLSAAYQAGFVWLTVLGVVFSVIGAFYYLRIIYFMYFGDSEAPLEKTRSMMQTVTLVASALFILVGVISLFGLPGLAEMAAQPIVQ